MGLAAGPVAGVAFVPMRFILDMEALGRESVAQLFRDQIACGHGKWLNQAHGVAVNPNASALLPPVKS